MLVKRIDINKYTIKLSNYKQSLYKSIDSLSILVKLKILKTYIKTNLANNFIYFTF